MTLEEETALLRLLQDGDASTLQHHMKLEVREQQGDLDFIHFSVTSGMDNGYLKYRVQPETGFIDWAEMDVNFVTTLGLNRSPLELRILCEEVEKTWPWEGSTDV